jgi:hypothetical protein
MASAEAIELYEIIRNTPKLVDVDLLHQRDSGERQEDMTSKPKDVKYDEASEFDGLWVYSRLRRQFQCTGAGAR